MKLNKVSVMILMAVFLMLVVLSCESPYLKGAKVYIQQEQWDKAKPQLIKAVEENPNDATAWFWLGRCYAYENDFENMNDAFDPSYDPIISSGTYTFGMVTPGLVNVAVDPQRLLVASKRYFLIYDIALSAVRDNTVGAKIPGGSFVMQNPNESGQITYMMLPNLDVKPSIDSMEI